MLHMKLGALIYISLSWRSIVPCSAYNDWPPLNDFYFTPYDPTQTKILYGRGTTECNLENDPLDVDDRDILHNIGIFTGKYSDGACYPWDSEFQLCSFIIA